MSYIQIIKEASFKPIYSPRTTYSRYFQEIDRLTTHLAINIDKYVLGFFKDQFQACRNSMSRLQFIVAGQKHLATWQKQLPDRQNKVIKCLNTLFSEIDQKKHNRITWEEFNSLLIEKVLNLKSLRNQIGESSVMLRPLPRQSKVNKFLSPVQKLAYINETKKIAYFCQESNKIEFISLQGSSHFQKSLCLNQQQLIVETTISRRKKEGGKESFKKEVMVANYKNTFLDMIYLNDKKYKMLLTSSSDKIVRGWDMSSSTLALARQPQNQDQKMVHQFPIEIHTMTWDNVNEVLYCSGKTSKIYEWMVKTDSETELWDENGHTEMISCMIMMPKLQFLATGGYDGKLVLWDTIAQQKKFVYQEHTRSIVDITFHEGLILLFTAAYDHTVCVWNPYIPSLIHKIPNNTNIIQLNIIPETNLLLTLDSNGLAKIRQVNKFSLISQFTIQQQDESHKIQATIMIATDKPVKYFFGGQYISSFEFVRVDDALDSQFSPLCLKYLSNSFKLLSPFKNNIFIWDLLTGELHNTLKSQSQSEITAYGVCQELKIAIIGDSDGQVSIRKADNGLLIKRIHQFKGTVTLVSIYNGGTWCKKIIFAICQDGDVVAFGKDDSNDFSVLRFFNTKKLGIDGAITSISYLQKRNLLILGTNAGSITFIDVDKSKVISMISTQIGQIHQLIQNDEIPLLIAFSRRGSIFGIYLPPHIKKFKPSCSLVCGSNQKITAAVMGKTNSKFYLGFQNGDIQYFSIHSDILTNEQNRQGSNMLKHIWKCSMGETIKDIVYIEKESILFVAVGEKGIFLISSDNGHVIDKLKKSSNAAQISPIFLLDEEKSKFFFIQKRQYFEVKHVGDENLLQIRKNHDPFYYLQRAQALNIKFKAISNKNWKFQPALKNQVSKNVEQIAQIKEQLQKFDKVPKKPRNIAAIDLQKAIQLQRRWQKLKQQQEEGKQGHSNLKATNMSGIKMSRGGSLHNLNRPILNTKINRTKQESNNPLLRLGIALQKIDQGDPKALKFIEMSKISRNVYSKSFLKLPKIV